MRSLAKINLHNIATDESNVNEAGITELLTNSYFLFLNLLEIYWLLYKKSESKTIGLSLINFYKSENIQRSQKRNKKKTCIKVKVNSVGSDTDPKH